MINNKRKINYFLEIYIIRILIPMGNRENMKIIKFGDVN